MSWYKWVGIGLLGLYIANLGFGVIEFIPDNLPFVGNLDEGMAGALIALMLKMK